MISIALLFCAVATFASGQDLLSLNVYGSNTSSRALDVVAANASIFYNILLDAEPTNYIWINPGDPIPESRFLERSPELGAVASPSSRRLLRSCPTTCAKSSSTRCKQLGCAYCGTRCRRRALRKLLFSTDEAAEVEDAINRKLRPLCKTRHHVGCSLQSEIYRVTFVNGTAVQTRLAQRRSKKGKKPAVARPATPKRPKKL